MFFLAIVAKQDLLRGNIVPSYILCKSLGESEARCQWRVCRANVLPKNAIKVLVKWPSGSDIMVNFMSAYRTRDHMHGSKRYEHESTKKYYPEGALFWFECNKYGEVIGPAVFVKNVPERKDGHARQRKQRLEEALSQKCSLTDLYTNDPFAVPLQYSGVKPKLYQPQQKVCNND